MILANGLAYWKLNAQQYLILIYGINKEQICAAWNDSSWQNKT